MENSRIFLAKWFAIAALVILGVELASTEMSSLFGGGREMVNNIIIPTCIFCGALLVFLRKWKECRWQQSVAVYGTLLLSFLFIISCMIPALAYIAPIVVAGFTVWGSLKLWCENKNEKPILPICLLTIVSILFISHLKYEVDGMPMMIWGFLNSVEFFFRFKLIHLVILIVSWGVIAYAAYRLIMNRLGKQLLEKNDKILAISALAYAIISLIFYFDPLEGNGVFFLGIFLGRYFRFFVFLLIPIVYDIYVGRYYADDSKMLKSAAVISCLSIFQIALGLMEVEKLIALSTIMLIAWIHYSRLAYNWMDRLRTEPQLLIRIAVIVVAAIVVLVLIIRTGLVITDAQSEGFSVGGYRVMIVIAAILFAFTIAYAILTAPNHKDILGVDEKTIAKYANLIAGVLFVLCLSISNISLRVKQNTYTAQKEAAAIENANNPRGRKGNYIFNSAQDVYNYLYGKTFVSGNTSISFSGSGMYVNGKCWTGAINVTNFSATRATCKAVSPYGGPITITVDCKNGYVINMGDTYYEQ